MSGGPPHHPHNRPMSAGNTAWNHLQVPNFFPRQPQHAHMPHGGEHPLLTHQPTWHTPTTEPLKAPPPHASHIINLEQMLSERQYLLSAPGVDLSVTRGPTAAASSASAAAAAAHNGDAPAAPISLSVRDTNKINSLAASALERQGELTKAASPPAAAAPAAKGASDKQLNPKIKKVKRMDSILERLNPPPTTAMAAAAMDVEPPVARATLAASATTIPVTPAVTTPAPSVAAATNSSSHDENSNSSSINNVPSLREEDVISPYSNDDSRDSNKSRRKRKPAKTMKVTKEAELPPTTTAAAAAAADALPDISNATSAPPTPVSTTTTTLTVSETQSAAVIESSLVVPTRRRSSSGVKGQEAPRKTRRKKSSDDETIDKIAAMIGTHIEEKADTPPATIVTNLNTNATSPKSTPSALVTPAQKKDFVAVEDKLEEMFAGLEDSKTGDDVRPAACLDESSNIGSIAELLNLSVTGNNPQPSTSLEKVSSTSNLDIPPRKKPQRKKRKGKQLSDTGKKKKGGRGLKNAKETKETKQFLTGKKTKKKMNGKAKFDTAKDVYAYDSGSNASSSKSRGPFVHINGPRDSPISVCIVNAPAHDGDDGVGKVVKKYHDSTDLRAAKVRAKGALHCSTLSTKYDTQTTDATWVCAFCKRGPYTEEFAANDAHYIPGDLFGPYAISSECDEHARRLHDPYDRAFKSKKIGRCLDEAAAAVAAGGAATTAGRPAKRGPKRKHDGAETITSEAQDVDFGIARIDDGGAMFEVWAHEDCIVWAPGIYLVGPKLVGLEAAVWSASNVACVRCAYKGANVCCVKRGCTNVMHLGCAYLARWTLDDVNFKSFCNEHAVA